MYKGIRLERDDGEEEEDEEEPDLTAGRRPSDAAVSKGSLRAAVGDGEGVINGGRPSAAATAECESTPGGCALSLVPNLKLVAHASAARTEEEVADEDGEQAAEVI